MSSKTVIWGGKTYRVDSAGSIWESGSDGSKHHFSSISVEDFGARWQIDSVIRQMKEEKRIKNSISSFDQNKNFPSNFGKDDDGCFIATAASASQTQLDFLRKYRDQKLRKSKSGSFLVDAYYQLSPPIVAVIVDHPKLKEFAKESFVSIALKIANKGLIVEEFTYEDGMKMGEVIGTMIAVKGMEFAEKYIHNVLSKAFDSSICGCDFVKGVNQGVKDSLKKLFINQVK